MEAWARAPPTGRRDRRFERSQNSFEAWAGGYQPSAFRERQAASIRSRPEPRDRSLHRLTRIHHDFIRTTGNPHFVRVRSAITETVRFRDAPSLMAKFSMAVERPHVGVPKDRVSGRL